MKALPDPNEEEVELDNLAFTLADGGEIDWDEVEKIEQLLKDCGIN